MDLDRQLRSVLILTLRLGDPAGKHLLSRKEMVALYNSTGNQLGSWQESQLAEYGSGSIQWSDDGK